MKTFMMLVLALGLLFCSGVFAQTDLTGTWQGKLATSPNEKLTIQFVLTKQADGSYKAVLNSPDTGGIKNVAATSVKLTGSKLDIDVASLSGSYSGTVAKGSITGEWKQQGSSFPMVLTPYKAPVPSTFKPLLGEWVGKLNAPGVSNLAIVFRFEMTKDGKFAAFMDVPDQNARNLALNDVTLEDNQVSLKFAAAGIEYTGKLSGNGITGTFKQGGAEFAMNLTKGKYEAPAFDLPAEDMQKLLGQWVGRWKESEETTYTVIFKFEKTKEGKLSANTNSPEQGSSFLPLTELSFKDNQLKFRIPATGGEYSGKLVDNSITGTYSLRGKQYEINVIKGAKVEPVITQVDIPAESFKQLLGRWNGKLNTASVVVRFEQKAGGKSAIFIDVPDQNQKDIPVLKASLSGDTLTLKFAGAEYGGKLAGNKIDGTVKIIAQNVILPLSLTKQTAAKK
jgi:hypothetical protein